MFIKHVFLDGMFSQANNLVSVNVQDVPDEVEGTSTPKRSRVNLRSPEDEEEHSLRRSSRIIQHKFNSRNQSVLYDRLITKWVS